jgi:hypothetical protein
MANHELEMERRKWEEQLTPEFLAFVRTLDPITRVLFGRCIVKHANNMITEMREEEVKKQ